MEVSGGCGTAKCQVRSVCPPYLQKGRQLCGRLVKILGGQGHPRYGLSIAFVAAVLGWGPERIQGVTTTVCLMQPPKPQKKLVLTISSDFCKKTSTKKGACPRAKNLNFAKTRSQKTNCPVKGGTLVHNPPPNPQPPFPDPQSFRAQLLSISDFQWGPDEWSQYQRG